uniref:N-acetyltransferase domain-containing protein n=1 Tax=Kalanchoe fedtschenkoi TaxID=63787 RepID=A0A7N0V912_KALFE
METLTLRPFALSDADDLLSWCDDRVTRNLRWSPLSSKQEALTFIQDVCIPHPWRRSICLSDRSIGFVSIFQESGENQFKAYIGYGVGAEHWNKGVATQAVKTAVAQVFRDIPNLVRLQAHVFVGNTASERVLEKAGFTKEGVFRKYEVIKGEIKDLVVYSFLSPAAHHH